ncbi:MAG: sialate O-acetylesterase, partial [Bdellovibrionaceae bacterium]|nr:sialate O-acetylesterase [Pseudobdellovibrionaceae bacterium]
MPVKKILVYLIGGQSNALGRGITADLPTSPVNLQLPQTNVIFADANGGVLQNLQADVDFGPEITMGYRLANSLAYDPSIRVAILKRARTGTSLYIDWIPGGDATQTGDGQWYVTFQNAVNNGLANLATAYPDAEIEIKGMLWVQGENDAKTNATVAAYDDYEANLEAFIEDVRLTYGDSLIFVISRLSDNQPIAGIGKPACARRKPMSPTPIRAT